MQLLARRGQEDIVHISLGDLIVREQRGLRQDQLRRLPGVFHLDAPAALHRGIFAPERPDGGLRGARLGQVGELRGQRRCD